MNKTTNQQPIIGILEWFHQGDKAHVERVLRQMEAIGIGELRTGMSWADYRTQEGRKWLDWLSGIDLLRKCCSVFLIFVPVYLAQRKAKDEMRDKKMK